MKKISYILIALVLTSISCTKMLDVQPTASVSTEQAIKDKEGVDKAITGAYYSLHDVGNYGRNKVIVEDLAADNLNWTGTTRDYQQIGENLIASDNAIIDGIWTSNYDCINRVNNVLVRIADIDMSVAERNKYTGDALFLRALSHYNLLCYFGAIPIKTKPTLDLSTINQARNSVLEVYTQIVADLLQAEMLLPAPANRALGWASSLSATALLARVYLSAFQYSNDPSIAAMAKAKAEEVINSGDYTLAPAYIDLFNGNTTESIFEVVFDAQNYNRLAQYFFPVSLTGRYEVSPPAAFVQSFHATDAVRYDASITFDAKNLPYGIKYKDYTSGTDRVYVLRLAEMYMIRAEALAWSNGSIEDIRNDINTLRIRSGLPTTTATSYDELKLAIEGERRHEFAFESQRWSDLVRTKRATTVLGIAEKYTLFPIPLSELQTNTLMTQNPGY
ncbi:MAG: RagB/SusD family nutrient uptake outer membrane protein [Bacteroidetes bacterium]|nr:RagB/SusD family nutrient uptake outer membrane protein [Bacteroidota bacterium]